MNLHELIKCRRTIRKFRQEPLSPAQLARYIDAARVAPSAANMQPLKYIAVCGEDTVRHMHPLVKWAGYLAPDYNPAENEQPVAFVAVCADLSVRAGGYEADMGAAVENLILSALTDGVGACWMGAIDYEKISALLGISGDLKLLCVVALGYPAETPEEAAEENGIKYYVGENGNLHVPKRALGDVLLKTM